MRASRLREAEHVIEFGDRREFLGMQGRDGAKVVKETPHDRTSFLEEITHRQPRYPVRGWHIRSPDAGNAQWSALTRFRPARLA